MKNIRVSRFYVYRNHNKVKGYTIDITLDSPMELKNSDDLLPDEIINRLKELIEFHVREDSD